MKVLWSDTIQIIFPKLFRRISLNYKELLGNARAGEPVLIVIDHNFIVVPHKEIIEIGLRFTIFSETIVCESYGVTPIRFDAVIL